MVRRSDAPGKKPTKKVTKQAGGKVSHGSHKPVKAGSIPAPATKNSKPRKATATPGKASKPAAKHAAPKNPTTPAKPAPKAREARGTAAKLLAAKPVPDPDHNDEDALTPSKRLFVREWLIDRNATRAYMAAFPGVTKRTAGEEGYRLLKNPDVKRVIDREFRATLTALGTSREEVIGRLIAVAFADPRDLVEVHVGACKACYGGDITDPFPGFWNTPPDPQCAHCGGEGAPHQRIKDTRSLSPMAAVLYAGAKTTKEGLQIVMHSQDAARESLMKHLGYYEKDNEQKQTPLGEALQALMAGIHETGSRMPIAPAKDGQG